MFAKLICLIFDHKWKYNFSTMPSKCICSRCKEKNMIDFKTIEDYKWIKVDSFPNEKRTDNQLIKTWTSKLLY